LGEEAADVQARTGTPLPPAPVRKPTPTYSRAAGESKSTEVSASAIRGEAPSPTRPRHADNHHRRPATPYRALSVMGLHQLVPAHLSVEAALGRSL
jgi:hypothetical protein